MENLQVIEQNGVRVLMTSQLAESYGTDAERINRNFNRNRDRYKEGKHFIFLEKGNLQDFRATGQIDLSPNINRLYLWTEKGAWLHAKSLNTDQAWDAYEMLVDDYYVKQQQVRVLSDREQLMASMKLSLELAEEFTTVKDDVNQLKHQVNNQMTIDHGQQVAIWAAKNKRVEKLWSDYVYGETFDTKRKLHAQAWRDLKLAFGVPSYRDIKKKDFEEALAFVKAWRPRMF